MVEKVKPFEGCIAIILKPSQGYLMSFYTLANK
jgi:hypothetical protein